MNTPHDVATSVQEILGYGSFVVYSDGFISIDYEHNREFIKIYIQPDGWDVYTTRHGMMWSGSLQETPPQDIIEQVLDYLSTFR